MNNILVENIAVEIDGKPLSGYLAKPPVPAPGVLVLHAWWGLTPFFKTLCDQLAEAGFMAFAPDFYDGKTASTIPEAEKLLEERDFERAKFIATSSVGWMRALRGLPENNPFQNTGLGLIGFSMGASWALNLSSAAAEDIKAVVLFYGAEAVDFSTVRAHFQGHFGEKDEWTPLSDLEAMEADMRSSGVQLNSFRYPEAGHWFFESNKPDAFREEDAALAWERTVQFLKDELIDG